MKTRIDGVRVSAIAAAVPKQSMGLADLMQEFGEAEVRRIVRATGIESLRIADGLTTGDLCAAAAQHLLLRSATDPGSIDAIILATQTPDRLMPGTSTLLQHRLGLSEDVVPYDINYGCSGYVFGLYLASSLLAGGACRRVLLCTGDVTTRLLGDRDRNVRMVFGDAATATLVERAPGEVHFLLRTDGAGADHLTTRWLPTKVGPEQSVAARHLEMDGAEVMGFALREVPRLVDDLLAFAGLERQQIELFALHQANAFMLQQLRRMLGVPQECLPVAVNGYGNTGPSSIPLMLCSSFAGAPLPRHALVCAFGVGLSYGACHANLQGCTASAPIEVEAPA